MKPHTFNIWSWEQEPSEVFFEADNGKWTGYQPNYQLFKNKVFSHKKFNLFEMKNYKITIEEIT